MGTQTSPRIYVKTPSRRPTGRIALNEPPQLISTSNLNIQASAELSRDIRDIEKLFEDSILRIETVERVPLGKQSSKSRIPTIAASKVESSDDDDEDSVMLFEEELKTVKHMSDSDDSVDAGNGNGKYRSFDRGSQDVAKEDETEKLKFKYVFFQPRILRRRSRFCIVLFSDTGLSTKLV